MQKGDISQVTSIDREAFPTQWPPPPFSRDLDSRIVRYLVALEERENPHQCSEAGQQEARGNLQGVISRIRQRLGRGYLPGDQGVAECEDSVVGYASMWLMVDEAHLTSIAVRETHRRLGIGEMLIIAMVDLALELKAQVMTLETRVSNRAAQALYEKYGFAPAGIRRRYYSDDGEDAVIMTTQNLISDSYQARFRQLKQAYLERWKPVREIGCPNLLPG
jgi:ribosomal-protein-alanine N-acetyltransferase